MAKVGNGWIDRCPPKPHTTVETLMTWMWPRAESQQLRPQETPMYRGCCLSLSKDSALAHGSCDSSIENLSSSVPQRGGMEPWGRAHQGYMRPHMAPTPQALTQGSCPPSPLLHRLLGNGSTVPSQERWGCPGRKQRLCVPGNPHSPVPDSSRIVTLLGAP